MDYSTSKERRHKYYEANKIDIREKQRVYCEVNREKIRKRRIERQSDKQDKIYEERMQEHILKEVKKMRYMWYMMEHNERCSMFWEDIRTSELKAKEIKYNQERIANFYKNKELIEIKK